MKALENEANNKIHFLDFSFINPSGYIEFNIYQKPVFTCIILLNGSCHVFERKTLATKYLVNRVNSYPISVGGKEKELTTIKKMLKNIQYPLNLIKEHQKQK